MVRTIVALDLPTGEAALALAAEVRDHVAGFKIGLGLLHGPGPRLIRELVALGRPVFADAKLHDIPSQVEAAARSLGGHGARWVTAHASGGSDMLRGAVAGLGEGNPDGGILAVTVLTSLDETMLSAVGIDAKPSRLAATMARVAAGAGCEGIVTSPHEVKTVAEAAPGLLRVIPGIRIESADDDQARTATPAEAVAAGADFLVVGRPITAAPEPAVAAAMIEEAAANTKADTRNS